MRPDQATGIGGRTPHRLQSFHLNLLNGKAHRNTPTIKDGMRRRTRPGVERTALPAFSRGANGALAAALSVPALHSRW
eukprot:1329796-Heterocapsa_arctica.AAC.1